MGGLLVIKSKESRVNDFKPDARQKALIERALKSHRAAQAKRKYAPRRLVERWSSEAGIDYPQDAQKYQDGVDYPRETSSSGNGRKSE